MHSQSLATRTRSLCQHASPITHLWSHHGFRLVVCVKLFLFGRQTLIVGRIICSPRFRFSLAKITCFVLHNGWCSVCQCRIPKHVLQRIFFVWVGTALAFLRTRENCLNVFLNFLVSSYCVLPNSALRKHVSPRLDDNNLLLCCLAPFLRQTFTSSIQDRGVQLYL